MTLTQECEMSGEKYYIPGRPHIYPVPFNRYLPPLPQGQVSVWLKEHVPVGSWILDPFGSCPPLVVEAAQAGYKVVVAINNPILRLLTELEAKAPGEPELRASLSNLAASYKGDQRIELHIRNLYETHCSQCGGVVEVDCFLWEKGAAHPYARIYTCSHCGDAGERAVLAEDRDKALEFSNSGLHRARALERVAPQGDPDREHALEALAVYLPRAIYALFTIFNKLNALSLPAERTQLLSALVLHACDKANTLWPHPTQRERPRQLTIPPKFKENNLWMALEEAVRLYGSRHQGVPIAAWPDTLPNEGGVLLFHGRLKDLVGKQRDFIYEAAFSAVPRPNQAFWTLSALWSGWLWGRESAAPIKTVLRRKRYDWGWHTGALAAVFSNLQPLLREKAPFFTLIGETEAGLLSATLTAGSWNGFDIEGLALRIEESQTQVHFNMTGREGVPELPNNIEVMIAQARKAAQDFLRQRGQPSPYIPLHASAVYALIKEAVHKPDNNNKSDSEESLRPLDFYNHVQNVIKESLTFRGGFLRFEGSLQNQEIGQWWLIKDNISDEEIRFQTPLADRVEKILVQSLVKNPTVDQYDLELEICKAFPGLMTPDLSLLTACLNSYAEKEPGNGDNWRLKAEDSPKQRWNDLGTASQAVYRLGSNLGYFPEKITTPPGSAGVQMRFIPIAWLDSKGEFLFIFYFVASAIVSNIMNQEQPSAKRRVLVFPPERSSLISYKLNSDPKLVESIKDRWNFLNFRQLEHLLENPLTTRKTFEESLSNSPIIENKPQMRLL
jgi:hypothetical protein